MNYEEMLKNFKIRNTKPREVIFNILDQGENGLDVERIKDIAEKYGYFINLSTVYRTLELFDELNLIDKYDLGENKYNYKMKRQHHTHKIICQHCHKDILLQCPMTKIEEIITKETGFKVVEHHLELKGICKDCSLKEKEGRNNSKTRKNH